MAAPPPAAPRRSRHSRPCRMLVPARGSEIPPGLLFGEAAVLVQWEQGSDGPRIASAPQSEIPACLSFQETHRPHTGACRAPCTWVWFLQPRGWKTPTWAVLQWGSQPHAVSPALHPATKPAELLKGQAELGRPEAACPGPAVPSQRLGHPPPPTKTRTATL